MGDIFNLSTTAFLIVHSGALIAIFAVLTMLKYANDELKKEKLETASIKNELLKIKSDLIKARSARQQVEVVLDAFEEENTKIRSLRKEIEDYKKKLLQSQNNGKKPNGKNEN